jgi:hypothetical protein
MKGHYNEKVIVTAKSLHLPSNKESISVKKLLTRYTTINPVINNQKAE